jgi:acylphosphatase
MICQRIFVYGKVQGVFFRKHTRDMAHELGIKGTVRNCADGSVMIEACGSKAAMKLFSEWCRQGPPHARVEKTETHTMPVKNFPSFLIVYT